MVKSAVYISWLPWGPVKVGIYIKGRVKHMYAYCLHLYVACQCLVDVLFVTELVSWSHCICQEYI